MECPLNHLFKNCCHCILPMWNHLPHVSLSQQSTVFFTNTSPALSQIMGSWVGQVRGSHWTLSVSLSQTHCWQPLCQVSPNCLCDETELMSWQQQIRIMWMMKLMYCWIYLFRLTIRSNATFNKNNNNKKTISIPLPLHLFIHK